MPSTAQLHPNLAITTLKDRYFLKDLLRRKDGTVGPS
jgi:hypothetical protein